MAAVASERTLFLFAYDIADTGRLRAVARVMEDYGHRMQQSVFVCLLTAGRYEQLIKTLLSTIEIEEDAITAFRVCQSCRGTVRDLGIPFSWPDESPYYIL